jgi:hypothetical protein
MFHKSFALAAVLATALAPAAFAGGWGNGWLDDGIDKESIVGTADFNLETSNVGVAEGDFTVAKTDNFKMEMIEVKGVQNTDGPDMMKVQGHLLTGGSGFAGAMSVDLHGNGSRAATGVFGEGKAKLELKTIERND